MKKKLLSILALLCLTVTSAWAQEEKWSGGTYTATHNESTEIIVNVNEDATLTINSGVTVTVNNGVVVGDGATLTIEGEGKLIVNGRNFGAGRDGGAAFTGAVIVCGGTVVATGGAGGKGRDGYKSSHPGAGGAGGAAFTGEVTVSGGTVVATGGAGGAGGKDRSDSRAGGDGGAGGAAFAATASLTFSGGTVTALGAAGGAGGVGRTDGQAGADGKAFTNAVTFNSTTDYMMFGGDDANSVTQTDNSTNHRYVGIATPVSVTANWASGAYWSTFYSSAGNFQAPEGTQVFMVKLNSDDPPTLQITEVEDGIVKSGQGVVLRQTAASNDPATTTLVMTPTASEVTGDFANDNSLKGTMVPITCSGENNYYVLNHTDDYGVGFYKLAEDGTGTIGANKAYLEYSASAGGEARPFFGFDEEVTGISAAQQSTEELDGGEWFDLQGRPVAHPTKGLYIVRQGKSRKVVVGN